MPRSFRGLVLGIAAIWFPAVAVAGDSVVRFHEVMYHPDLPGPSEAGGEWIELHNARAVDVDMSGWRLSAGVAFTFPKGTVILAGGYLVVAGNPAQLGVPAMGPWDGRLANDGERLELKDNNGREMDAFTYGTGGAWSAAPDGGGYSLSRIGFHAPTEAPESWASSRRVGGTPGSENFPAMLPPVTTALFEASAGWRFEASGDPGGGWELPGFDDGGWEEGGAAFQRGGDALPEPAVVGTALPAGGATAYFRREFSVPSGAPDALRLRFLADDGAAFFLNGTELARHNLAGGVIGHATPALSPRRAPPEWFEFELPASLLVPGGENVLAASLHQAAPLPGYVEAVLAAGPVAYWRFGDAAERAILDLAHRGGVPEMGAQDGAAAGFDAADFTQSGPRPADTVGGQPLLGFEADNRGPLFRGNASGGNDAALFPEGAGAELNFAASRRFTLSAWVRGPAAQESGAAIICKGTGGGGEQFAVDVVGGYRFFAWNATGTTPSVAQSGVTPNGSWQHVVAVFDQPASVMRLYVNGTQVASATPPTTMRATSHEVSVGARKNSGSGAYDLNFDGRIDEVALYGRAFSAAEVGALFNAAFAPGSGLPDADDAVFAAALEMREVPLIPPPVALRLNEVSTSGVEVANAGTMGIDVAAFSLRQVSGVGTVDHPLPAQVLAPGALLSMPLGLAAGDRLILRDAAGLRLDDAVVRPTVRGRHPDGTGEWHRVRVETPGTANEVLLRGEIVINEILYDHPPAELTGPAPRAGQWIELHNRSDSAVDLSGWQLRGGVDYDFSNAGGPVVEAGGFLVIAEDPSALVAAHGLGGGMVFGPWSGNLSHRSDRIRLEDAANNTADAVTFHRGGRWPEAANAGGSSLELIDPHADNAVPESWAASDESDESAWQTFTWSGPATPAQTGEPTHWNEIDLCLIDGPGECLIDDVRVTDLVTGTNLVPNGNFSAGVAHWRRVGTHRDSTVVPEPGNSGNPVLRLRATGPGEYQGNQIESTFVGNQALVSGRNYEISLRARWISGGGRLNTRLYFNRVAKTNILLLPASGGTPGAENSRRIANAGPTFADLSHAPLVPAAGEAVTVRVRVGDPQGVAAATLHSLVEGVAAQTAMAPEGGGSFVAQIAGAPANALVQFYVAATDGDGATAFFPAAGNQSRAVYQVGPAPGTRAEFRLVMTRADAQFLHTPVNALSNAYLGATVIADGRAYYDVGVRLKGSFVGRDVSRVGFGCRFDPSDPFRGIHEKASVDRSMHVAIGQGEILVKHMASVGGVPSMHDDLAHFVHPLGSHTSSCSLRLAAFEREYLRGQFPGADDGPMYEFEVIRHHSATVDGNVESPKLPGGQGYTNNDLRGWGADREAYRWTMLHTNNRDTDDYARIIEVQGLFGSAPVAFAQGAPALLDLDEWWRSLAFQSLVGPADAAYTGSNIHNFRLYVRPDDGRTLYLPWDWDSAFQRATNASVFGGGNIAKVATATPHFRRMYLAHLFDLCDSVFNVSYMSRWAGHYGAVNGEDFGGMLNYIGQRSAFVLGQLPTAQAFTAGAGAVDANGAVLVSGTAAIRIAGLLVNGLVYQPVWSSDTAWSITVPLAQGPNTLHVSGVDLKGEPVAGASATLEVTNSNPSGWPELRINEWLADGPGADWFEIHNGTPSPVSLAGWRLSDDPLAPAKFVVPGGWSVPAGGFLLVFADNETVLNSSAPAPGDALHVPFALNLSGESLVLGAPDGRVVDRVDFGAQTFGVSEGRYRDGGAIVGALSLPSPASPNVRVRILTVSREADGIHVTVDATPGWNYRLHFSPDMATWQEEPDSVTAAGETVDFIFPVNGGGPHFLRAAVEP